MHATHTATLAIDHIPRKVKKIYMFLEMKNKCLLSLGIFCDNGYEVHLTKEHIYTTHIYDSIILLKDNQDPYTQIWTVNNEHKSNTTEHSGQQCVRVQKVKKRHHVLTSTWITSIQNSFFTT